MSSVFKNRQARCAHLRRTRQKIQFGAKDQRLFAHKGKRATPSVYYLASLSLSGRSHLSPDPTSLCCIFIIIFFPLIARMSDVPDQWRMEKFRIRVAGFCVLSAALLNFVIMFRNVLMMKSACSCSNVHIHAPRARVRHVVARSSMCCVITGRCDLTLKVCVCSNTSAGH